MRERNFAPSRLLIYLAVSLVAVAYLVPLIVVVLNSLRSNEEIVQTSMIGWPRQWAFGNYLLTLFVLIEKATPIGRAASYAGGGVLAATFQDLGSSPPLPWGRGTQVHRRFIQFELFSPNDLKSVAEDFVRDLPVLCWVGVGFARPRSSFGRKALQRA